MSTPWRSGGPGPWPPDACQPVGFRYAVLASAIASRRLRLEPTESGPTYTDGRTIFLGVSTEPGDIGDAVAIQAALLAGGAFEMQRMAAVVTQRTAQRYLSLEIARIAAQQALLLPTRTLHRVESAGLQPLSSSSDESLRYARSREPVPLAPLWVGSLRPARLRRVAEEDLQASPPCSSAALGDNTAAVAEDDTATEDSKVVRFFSVTGNPGRLSAALQKLRGPGGARDNNPAAGESLIGRQRRGPAGRRDGKGPVDRFISAILEPSPIPGIRYPEWDCHRNAYRPEWCLVAEGDPPLLEAICQDAAVGGASVQRPLARVGIELERHSRQPDGDALDMTALVEYEVDRRRGRATAPNVYESSRLTRRDLSVLVLLDCSGSTTEESGGHMVFDEERRLAGRITGALERLGDRVATYGFNSQGRDRVRFLRIKPFNARFDTSVKRRLQSVQPSGFTRIGAAIRHAAHVLESQALARNMVLLVIGDGLPYDSGYENRYARADARQAIRETMLRGIGVVGIGIRSATDPWVLEDVWSEALFRVIGPSDDVKLHLRSLFLGALNRTRTNGRRRDMLTEQHREFLRLLETKRRGPMNSYQ